jgi:SulP family sulfate permease
MFALSFFGIIHVPINVPALGIAVQEDDVNINRELLGHGISNMLSGLVGSVQNYLVFANSRLFIQNGGNSRWAGILLAIATTGVWIAGPAMIGYIPIMVVGTLIFMLGIEMIQEALWDTFGKLHRLEWLTVLAITVVMGFHDFVVGIVLGIILACLLFVVQTSRISAIRATYSGVIAESTVRRHPVQRRFLHAVGSQISVTKLAGYLFFGTIVAVEKKIRELIAEERFQKQPIRYLILDFGHVTGLDFSAAEAFVRMHRILGDKQVEMVLSNVHMTGEIGKSLIMVGLLSDEDENLLPPKIFEDLNQALEACENELLMAFKIRGEAMVQQKGLSATSMTIPRIAEPGSGLDALFSSPRRNLIQEAATRTLNNADLSVPAKWQNFAQPLPLILQAFKDLTTKDFDFWHRAVPFFEKRTYPAGRVLYTRGDEPDGFYLLEDGILRAEYQLEQGSFYESIVAGTTCGELPFFAETERSGTVIAEKDTVVWLLTKSKWTDLEDRLPDVARELLKVGLKLTSERMNTITS